MTEYGNESITQREGAERLRLDPNTLLGSSGKRGAFHTIREIMGNALDEARGGNGNTIVFIIHADGSISIRDFGRGVPMGYNKGAGQYNWFLVFNELYAGGKYTDVVGSKDDNYIYSEGQHGIGAAAAQYTSEYFVVESCREGKKYTKRFEKGYPVGELEVEEYTGQTGTYIRWKIDKEVFTNTDISYQELLDYCREEAHINKVKVIVIDEETEREEIIEGRGIEHYLKSFIPEENQRGIIESKGKIRGVKHSKDEGYTLEQEVKGKRPEGRNFQAEIEVKIALTEKAPEQIAKYYHNSVTVSGGAHETASKNAILEFYREYGREEDLLILERDCEENISIAISTYSNITSFANQTKDLVDDKFIEDLVYNTVYDMLRTGIAKGNEELVKTKDRVLESADARRRARELMKQAKDVRSTQRKKKKAEKLQDCGSDDNTKTEVFIVEGDSAAGSCMGARDGQLQAILPVKGKTLNCLKAGSLKRILDNQEIKDLITTIGTGIDLPGNRDLFDIDKIAYSKIIIATDADVDGYQIRVLLFTFFYVLMPELLRQGRVYIAETPLFEIEVVGQKKSIFAYTLEEKEKVEAKLKKEDKKIKVVHRYKGLGEADPDMLWDTTMNPKTRKLTQLKIDTHEEDVKVFTDMLFGNDEKKDRKEYIIDYIEQKGVIDLEVEKAVIIEGDK